MHSVLYTSQVGTILNTILSDEITYRCLKIRIFKNVMPGQNQYFDFFKDKSQSKGWKMLSVLQTIKCAALWVLFWVMKLLIVVKKQKSLKTLCRDKINILTFLKKISI